MAGWNEVWHLLIAIVARQSPFVAIMLVTLAVFFVVMAAEGVRASLAAIRYGHRTAPTAPPVPEESPAPAERHAAPRLAAAPRRPKPLTLPPRRWAGSRPTIRRAPLILLPESPAKPPLEFPEPV